jgi:ABC-type glycerol-3-phosphate transport system substrate-binding protein
MGDFTNVDNARELLGSLFLQLGNPITKTDASTGAVSTTLRPSISVDPISALQFFTQFIDPNKPNYSWNRSMPDSRTAFLSGISATYFGFASELASIRAKNPNLNFDVAPLPQVRTGGQKAAYAKMLAFSLVRSSPNTNAAFQIISMLNDPQYLGSLATKLYLPSVRRDVIAQGSTDPYISIFNQAALISKTWLDADPTISRGIFANMVEAVTSGQKQIYQAIQDAADQYDLSLKQAFQ